MKPYEAVEAWEEANVEAGNDECVLCGGAGHFQFYEADRRPGHWGEFCDCIAGRTMPPALRRFLASMGYGEPQ